MSESSQVLVEQIEQLVRAHIESTRRAAAGAVERAFSASAPSATRRRRRPVTERAARRSTGGRRSRAELAALGEQLHEAVRAHSGETMSVLAEAVGLTARELHRPMKALKLAGRVRSVGQRDQTRYFPAVERAKAS